MNAEDINTEDVPTNPYQFLDFLRNEPDYARVFYFIAKKKATFFSEICDITAIDERKVKRIMAQLREAGHIERIQATIDAPDPRLLSRTTDMFNKGIYGIERWSQMGWHGVINDGTYVLQIKDGEETRPVYPDGRPFAH